MKVIFVNENYSKEYILETLLKETKSFGLVKIEEVDNDKIIAEFIFDKEEENCK